eukprot:1643398-Amphidinium_carterae.1
MAFRGPSIEDRVKRPLPSMPVNQIISSNKINITLLLFGDVCNMTCIQPEHMKNDLHRICPQP